MSDLLGLVVLKLNVKTVLNSHFHLYGGVKFWISAECVHYDVHLFADIIQSPADGCPQEISEGKNKNHLDFFFKNLSNKCTTYCLSTIYTQSLLNYTMTGIHTAVLHSGLCRTRTVSPRVWTQNQRSEIEPFLQAELNPLPERQTHGGFLCHSTILQGKWTSHRRENVIS